MADKDDKGGAPVLRADARRNRDRLVAAAKALMSAQGVAVPLESIARQAGLGIGTLYRHFPSREALIEAVYREEHEALLAAADSLAASLPPDEALARWMQHCLDYMETKRGLGEGLRQIFITRPELLVAIQQGFPRSLARLLAAAVAAGRIRADVQAEDLQHALFGLYSAPPSPEWRARSGRVLTLLLEGLRTPPPPG